MILIVVFVLGYLAIVFEHKLELNKAASALLTGVICWTVLILSADAHVVDEALQHQLGEVSGILFFLLGAMTIVELIDAHDGFDIITARITSVNRRKLLLTIASLGFLLSAVLDNLTTSIVMMSLVRKLMKDDADRMTYGGVVILAANAGGAWSPIGDVTTTMLWVGGQITALGVVKTLLLPSLVSVAVPVAWIAFRMKGEVTRDETSVSSSALTAWLAEVEKSSAEQVARAAIALPEGAAAIGKTLAELELRSRTGVAVLTSSRDGGNATLPSPNDPLRAGDVLELVGPTDAIMRGATHLYAADPTSLEHSDVMRSWLDDVRAATAASARTPVTLPSGAMAVGRTLAELNLRVRSGVSVLTIRRDGGAPLPASPRDPLRAGDVLEIAGAADAVPGAVTLLYTNQSRKPTTAFERGLVLAAGVFVLLFVPVFKALTHLPPFMGMLMGLGALWALTEVIHKSKNHEDKGALTVASVLRRVDTESVLFFLGILLAIGALQSAGLLSALAHALDQAIGNADVITLSIGLSSAVVDNVPLVAAAQGMYPLSTFPTDHHFWFFLAFCAATGGSILIIGSAAGIAVMGIQRITFGWYVRHMSLPALIGYVAGALVYLASAG